MSGACEPTSADDLVEVEQQLLAGDDHVLHLRQQVRVEAGRVDVDQQGGRQLALRTQTEPAPQPPQAGGQQLAVAPVDGRSPPARPVGALVWRGEGGGVSSQVNLIHYPPPPPRGQAPVH